MTATGRLLVGIDLGTTNTVAAFARLGDGGATSESTIFLLPQLVARGEVASRATLPSSLYAPLDAEQVADPWTDPPWAGGDYAKRRGAEVPGRGVASAKSWLAYDAVDRHAAILPWGADAESSASPSGSSPRISPVDASARYLEHVRRAWDAAHPAAPLAEQEIVLTVPASFDETARELTLEAANSIGLAPRLLEEPTAAFYDWMRREGEAEVAALIDGGTTEALVLVCDVGGGTTDLSLIRVAASEGSGVEVSRVAVGRHLLLGGDNMDLALAHHCERKMTTERLDAGRFAQLVAACRDAKEKLLCGLAEDDVTVAIAGAGARLIGNTLSATVTRAEVDALVVDGFFPRAARDAQPVRARTGLIAFGLPYERDVAITRHVAAFVARHAVSPDGTPIALRALLLNGGVFRAPRLVSRLVEAIDAWGGPPLRLLRQEDPDLAVARGAVAYALARHGMGIRIGGGSARGFYVEVAGDNGAARTGVCVVPRGAREGVTHVARTRPLDLALGKPARFELWASDEARRHSPGDVVSLDGDGFTRLLPIAATFGREARTTLRTGTAPAKDEHVRVALEGELTEVGTLDLACMELEPRPGVSPRRFRLAFALRGGAPPPTAPPPSAGAAALVRGSRALEAAVDAVARVFGKGRSETEVREVKDLLRELERILGERTTWDTGTTRALFDVLAPGRSARRRSADHERVFWQLAGFCLRPGFGDPMDPARIELLAPLVPERLSFPDQTRSWQQFFIAFRRVAAGMNDAQQTPLRDLADPWLAPAEARAKMGKKSQKGSKPLADPEMIDMVASLERVPAARRGELGGWILDRIWTDRDPRLWAAVGRLGARVPAYASLDHVIEPKVVERWVEQLLREKWDEVSSAAAAAVALGRVTGDRARDLSENVRKDLARRLTASGAAAESVRAVTELVAVDEEERAAFWGESLPVGLRLATEKA